MKVLVGILVCLTMCMFAGCSDIEEQTAESTEVKTEENIEVKSEEKGIENAQGPELELQSTPYSAAFIYVNGLAEVGFDILDRYTLFSSDRLLKPMIENTMEKNSISEQDAYKLFLADLPYSQEMKAPSNFKEFIHNITECKEKEIEAKYGKKQSMSMEIGDIEDADKEEAYKEVFDFYNNYSDEFSVDISDVIDISEIEDMKKTYGTVIYYETEGRPNVIDKVSRPIYIVKIDGGWTVFNKGWL